MKSLVATYKPVLQFLGIFLGTYFLLTFIYNQYLGFAQQQHTPDAVTQLVAAQATAMLQSFEFNAQLIPDNTQPFMNLFIDGKHLANIVEGCNGVSVLILFIAFVLAFSQGVKKTFLFLLGGCVLIYGINVVRIAFLAMALHKFPESQEVLHQLVFPAIIYGAIVLLWVIWVRGISKTTSP